METRETSSSGRFEKLKNFDFKHNKVFQEGWKKIKGVVSKDQMFESLVKAQVFFFSREVEAVNFEDYKKWLVDQGTNKEDYLRNHMPAPDDENMVESSKTETVVPNPENSCDDAGKHPESFAELIEMIQNGLKLPDTEGPDIEPVNDDPSAAVIERKKKPWEDT